MTDWITIWWVWISLALVLAIVEVVAPGFIFLGIAIGAAIQAVLLLALPDVFGQWSPNALMALFGGLSLASWIVLRQVFRKQSSGAKTFSEDVND